MAELTPTEEETLREAIGVLIDHGNPALGASLAQWITARKVRASLTHSHCLPPRLEVVAAMET